MLGNVEFICWIDFQKLTLEEWVFVADNVAMFPYQVMDEPLYVIRQIESIVSVSGQSIINNFMNQLLPRPNGLEQDDETEYNPEIIYSTCTYYAVS